MKNPSRALAAVLALSLVLGVPSLQVARAAEQVANAAPASDEVKPKFVWGVLLNIAFKVAMSAFEDWLKNKMSSDLTQASDVDKLMLDSAQVAVVFLNDYTPYRGKGLAMAENTVVGKETKPLSVDNGRENYQGAHVAIVSFDQAGKPGSIQPVAATFHTGDRIKVKVLPTFDALAVIENITPKGERVQIYPRPGEAVSLKAGHEVFLPANRDDYFEFAGATGDEQLVITLRDPRAANGAASPAQVSRKDEPNGSRFVQETPNGTFPVIAQSLALRHQGAAR